MRRVHFVLTVIAALVWGLAAWLKDRWLPGLPPAVYWLVVVAYLVLAGVVWLRGLWWVAAMLRRNTRNGRRDSSGDGR